MHMHIDLLRTPARQVKQNHSIHKNTSFTCHLHVEGIKGFFYDELSGRAGAKC